jgi:hypothetical protein
MGLIISKIGAPTNGNVAEPVKSARNSLRIPDILPLLHPARPQSPEDSSQHILLSPRITDHLGMAKASI